LGPSNKNLKLNVLLAGILGLGLGMMLGFIRSYLDNNDMEERKKLRRIKHFFRKKTKEIIQDRRFTGIVSVLMLVGLPFYVGYESNNPVFFGRYSPVLMVIISVYILMLLSAIGLFIFSSKRN